jgi:putative oxidoreductase
MFRQGAAAMIDQLQHGLNLAAVGLTLNRVALGTFFAISGYHKLFNKQRHAALVDTLKQCHVPAIGFNQWWVPSVEFFGGLSLISGILAPLASTGLIVICLIAILTDGLKRVAAFKPIDRADWCDDFLYLPEVLYLFGLITVITAGPGVVPTL